MSEEGMNRFRMILLCQILLVAQARLALADRMRLSSPLAEEILSETLPTAFAPSHFDVNDFEVTWADTPLPQIQFRLEKGSFDWVRVQEVLVVPRARLVVEFNGIESGQMSHAGYVTSLQSGEGSNSVQMPVALLSGVSSPIQITIRANGKTLNSTLRVRFKPRAKFFEDSKVYIDASCSPYRLKATLSKLASESWMYVGCRLVHTAGEKGRTSSLEAFVFWDNVGRSIEVDGIETSSPTESVWHLRLSSSPDRVKLRAGESEVVLNFRVPQRLRHGQLSIGLGPYDYRFSDNTQDNKTLNLLFHLYGSYLMTETVKLVVVAAMTADTNLFTDLGGYLRLESYRAIDRRLGIHLLLGAHAVGFKSLGDYNLVGSFPQGIQFVFYDAFQKGKDIKLGAFVYPLIAGRAYYNIWLRWGDKVFTELNFYHWQSDVNSVSFRNTSIGLSIGFPLFGFL